MRRPTAKSHCIAMTIIDHKLGPLLAQKDIAKIAPNCTVEIVNIAANYTFQSEFYIGYCNISSEQDVWPYKEAFWEKFPPKIHFFTKSGDCYFCYDTPQVTFHIFDRKLILEVGDILLTKSPP